MRFLKVFFALVLFLLIPISVYALNLPNYSSRVNDFAQIFSSDFKLNLEQKLTQIETNTTNQIAVVTVENLQGITIEDYSEQLFKYWGIGQKEKDNGILVLIALEEKQVRIEVGYGLEPIITDGRAGEIIRKQITPEFKNGNYEKGVLNGIDKINQYFTGQIIEDPPQKNNSKNNSNFSFFLFIFLSFISYAFAFMARSKSFYAGGIGGAAIGFIIGLFVSLSFALTLFFIIGLIGLFLDFILSKNYKKLKKLGKSTGFWSSSGGFRGGLGGGGFGGFRGGSSGGGGASGSW